MSDPHPLVCRFGALGDMIMLTPMLRHLHRRGGLPCDIVGVGGWNRMLFERMPWVRRVYTIDSRAAPYWFNRSQRALVHELRRAQHRFAWICETDARSYRLLARAGIDRDNSVSQPDLEAVGPEHYTDKWLRLANLSPPGFDAQVLAADPADTTLFVGEDEIDECRRWLARRGIDPAAPIVCFQAGNKRTMRRGRADRASNTKYWHERNWAEVAERILAREPRARILLCGVPGELEMCEAIRVAANSRTDIETVADDLPMRRLLALLSLAHSCVSVDTGPAHAAAALNCPVVVLFGKANPVRFRPVSSQSPVTVLVGEAPGSEPGEPDISRITPERVFAAWSELA